MKSIVYNKSLLLLLSMVSLAMASCLKDKGFENGEYGAIRGTEGKEFVTIPKAARKTNPMALESKAGEQTIKLFTVAYDYVDPAGSDITATVKVNNDLVTAADPDVVILPASVYSVPNNTITVSAGGRISNEFAFNINTSTLDPTKKYGIGFTLESVSKSGVSIPDNMKNVVFVFALKNKYDGVYTLKGYHNRVPYNYPYETEIHMVTTGPNSVIFYWPEAESEGHPIGVGPGSMSWYGPAISPVVVFDPATDLVTDVYNNPPNPTVITMFTGTGSRVSKYDPATKSITVDWNYNGNPERAFFDDLTYIGPRP